MIINVLIHAIMISVFVFFMMLLIEYVNVQTEEKWQKSLGNSRWKQYFLGAFLGAVPGCLGAFVVVSLYSHGMMSIGAVVTAMIATSGDEAFVMFSLFPVKALWITGVLFVVGIAAGVITDFFFKDPHFLTSNTNHDLPFHKKEVCHCFPKDKLLYQIKNISFERALLMGFLSLFLVLIFTGSIGPAAWNWKRITFAAGSLFSLFVVSTVPDHFLKEHLWEHILKQHLPRIFLWTFGTLLVLHFLEGYIDIESWIQSNLLIMLVIAVLVGIIPESGPHLIFVAMFMKGTIPISILLASSIVQDGHGMLPMLAVSKRSFIYVKLINVIVGFLIGFIWLKLL